MVCRLPGGGCPGPGAPEPRSRLEEQTMTTRSEWRQIDVSEENYDVLARTAAMRGTGIDGVLRCLLMLPTVPTVRPEGGDEE